MVGVGPTVHGLKGHCHSAWLHEHGVLWGRPLRGAFLRFTSYCLIGATRPRDGRHPLGTIIVYHNLYWKSSKDLVKMKARAQKLTQL